VRAVRGSRPPGSPITTDFGVIQPPVSAGERRRTPVPPSRLSRTVAAAQGCEQAGQRHPSRARPLG
jgi:hypothetical protein